MSLRIANSIFSLPQECRVSIPYGGENGEKNRTLVRFSLPQGGRYASLLTAEKIALKSDFLAI